MTAEAPSNLSYPTSPQPHQQEMPGADPPNLPSSSGAQDKPVYEEMYHLSGFYMASLVSSVILTPSAGILVTMLSLRQQKHT